MNRPAGKVATQRSFLGYACIATATLFWGISATLGRAVFTGRLWSSAELGGAIDPLILSQSRITFAFLVFLPVLSLSRGWRRLQLPAADLLRMSLLGVLGVAVSNYFYYVAIQRTNVATAITVQYTAPIWVLLYMVVAGLQILDVRKLLAVLLALTGTVLVVGPFHSTVRLDALGIGAALLAAFAFAFYNIGGHGIVARYDHWLVLLYITGSASVFWMVINPPWKIAAHHYSARSWAFLMMFSLVSALAPFSFYIAGLRYLDPTRAIVASCLEPVFSIVIAALALGEVVRLPQVVGIVVVLAGILVVQIPDRKSKELVTIEPIE